MPAAFCLHSTRKTCKGRKIHGRCMQSPTLRAHCLDAFTHLRHSPLPICVTATRAVRQAIGANVTCMPTSRVLWSTRGRLENRAGPRRRLGCAIVVSDEERE